MSDIDPRTPVLVGAGTFEQREEDHRAALEPLELMVAALEYAADDAGSREILARADSIRAPRGFWKYPDPCRMLATRFGADDARTEISEIGVLQTTLFGRAADDIAGGRCDVVLIAAAEARYRALRAKIAGEVEDYTEQLEVEPDSVLRPADEIINPSEIEHGIFMPVSQYAIIENALRYAARTPLAAHRDEVARLWAELAVIAADNPHAWVRDAPTPDAIRDGGHGNRMLAFPYTKLHTSQWNVDQAVGFVLCSAETATAAGVPREKWVFPLAVADSNHMVSLSERRALHRSPGFEHAGRAALAGAAVAIDDVEHLELYSCFPAAVRIQQRELGIAADRAVSVTGGMAFAGGPVNHFMPQALARMVEILRAQPGSTALLTAVSGMVTKQGVSLWASTPPRRRFTFDDVSQAAARETERAQVVAVHDLAATVASYTVLYDGEAPPHGVLLCDLDDGNRTLVDTHDETLIAQMTSEECCGLRAEIRGGLARGLA